LTDNHYYTVTIAKMLRIVYTLAVRFYWVFIFISCFASSIGSATDLPACPVPSIPLEFRDRPFDEVVLVPGAGAKDDDLVEGFLLRGPYYSEIEKYFTQAGIGFELIPADRKGNSGLA